MLNLGTLSTTINSFVKMNPFVTHFMAFPELGGGGGGGGGGVNLTPT